MDLYAKRALSAKGLKTTHEQFIFGLAFSTDAPAAVKTFLESNRLTVGEYHFMGHKTTKGPLGVVVEAGV